MNWATFTLLFKVFAFVFTYIIIDGFEHCDEVRFFIKCSLEELRKIKFPKFFDFKGFH